MNTGPHNWPFDEFAALHNWLRVKRSFVETSAKRQKSWTFHMTPVSAAISFVSGGVVFLAAVA
jgi:hypothetical protein